jgi:Mor family transcriptional regulator
MKCVALLDLIQEGVICMSYVNGKKVLPENILSEIQKYFGGGLIYIPLSKDERCKWGSRTNTRTQLHKRNQEIRHKKDLGMSIQELMEEYHLSYDSIKRIIYKH